MLQQDEPDDYVIATRRDALRRGARRAQAFEHVGLDWREHVRVDESLKRGKAELHDLVGDAGGRAQRLGWEPEVSFEELVRLLVDAELERLLGASGPELAVDRVVRRGRALPREERLRARARARPLVRVRRGRRSTASAIARGSCGSKRRAASPTTSGSDAAFEHATGQPQAIASSGGRPKPS